MFNMFKILPVCAFVAGMALVSVTNGTTKAPTSNNGPQDTYEWFQISGTHSQSTAVPPTDAVYIGPGATIPAGDYEECDGSLNQCVSGFNNNQTTLVGGERVLNGSQTPAPAAAAASLLKD